MNLFREVTHRSEALGAYHSGLFYSDTVFPEAVLAPKTIWIDPEPTGCRLTTYDWSTPVDVLHTATLFHETIHYLQDLATGFGCMYCFATRDFLRHFSGIFRILGTDKLRPPLMQWVSEERDPAMKTRLARFLSIVDSHPTFLKSILSETEYTIDPAFRYYPALTGAFRVRKGRSYTIGTKEIVEGMGSS